MGIIKRSCIEAIKNQVSIQDVVLPYVNLKRSGSSWRGLSPFTSEKSPSFFAIPSKNIFKCFSSGHAGDAIRFIQLKENISFQESVELLAHRFDIPLEYEASGNNTHRVSLHKELIELYEEVTDFFSSQFMADTDIGAMGRAYWTEERAFPIGLAEVFRIGIAPVTEDALLTKLQKTGYSAEAINASGLFYVRPGDIRIYGLKPRFRGRLMIPIKDIHGRVIAFSGRKLSITPQTDPTFEAKYINSPESLLFHKGSVLFGLDHARTHAADTKPFYLVEGPLDVIRCVQRGMLTVVSAQGTGVTPAQLEILRRYTSTICIFLDGDVAGQKAALRLLPLAFKSALEVCFLPLPAGQDPDLFLSKASESEIQAYLETLQPSMLFLKEHLFANRSELKPNELSKTLTSVYEILYSVSSEVARIAYLKEFCTYLNVDIAPVLKDFEKFLNFYQNRNQTSRLAPVDLSYVQTDKLTSVEGELLLLMLHHELLATELSQMIELEWLKDTNIYGQLLIRFINDLKEGIHDNLKDIDVLLETDEEKDLIYNLLAEEPPFESPVKVANQCLKKIYTEHIYACRQAIEHEMAINQDKSPDAMRPFQEARMKLRQLLQSPPQLTLTNL